MKNWLKVEVLSLILVGLFMVPLFVFAHQSGCHRWHSCPSDSGSYTCGDAGHPCLYPTYPASGGVIYPPSGYYKDCYDCPLKKVPENAYTSGIGYSCNDGYILRDNQCITHSENCQKVFGLNTYGVKGNSNDSSCYCQSGYKWNSSQTACIKDEGGIISIEENKNDDIKTDLNFANKLKGKLLLQVEQGGKIWYVAPTTGYKHEVTFANALDLFQKLAVGITDANLNKIPLHTDSWTSTLGNTSKGKLFLQVEQRGKIWYIDFNGKRWEVTWANLMDLFKSLALGITDSDLNKIQIGD